MSSVAPQDVAAAVAQFCGKSEARLASAVDITAVETHISWVLLTCRFAFKLKKPVRFEFLDFSTAEKRHQACLDELRLNRRLAPDIYLAVLPITRTSTDELAIDGDGVPIEWVVQMRRLPYSRSLGALIQNKQLTIEDSEAVIAHLAKFYRGLPSVRINPRDYLETIERHIRANQATLLTAAAEQLPRVRRVISKQWRYLRLLADVLAQRVAAGKIVDGHGDLRPEHVYLNRHPCVIDCVEFSEELRRVDIADDLSFLAMECEHLGAADLGSRIMATYETICGDTVPTHLTAFYRCYRACVRAKITLLRAQQQASDLRENAQFAQYLHLADIHAAELGPPMVVIVGGLMGSGKTTLAAQLSHSFGMACISTDSVRRDLFGPSDGQTAYGEALYRPEMRRTVYGEVLRQAEERLGQGESVVLDGTFLTAPLRQEAYATARRHGAVPVFVLCKCSRSAAIARIESRGIGQKDASEARAELFDLHSREFEAPRKPELYVEIDTVCPMDEQAHGVFNALRQVIFGVAG